MLKEPKDYKVLKVIQDLKDMQVLKEPKDFKVLKVIQGLKVV